MKKGLVVCRTGMGSSMMLRIKLEQVISENNFPIELEHDVLSALNHHNVDFVVTMKDLAGEVEAEGKKAIGIEDLMNKIELKEKLEKFLSECEL